MHKDKKNASYDRERKYDMEKPIVISEEMYDYWKKVLGEDTIEFLEKDHKAISNLYNTNFTTEYSVANRAQIAFYNKKYLNVELPRFTGNNQVMFFNYYAVWLRIGILFLKNDWKGIFPLNNHVIAAFSEQLYGKLSVISIRTLVLELNICKETKKLRGSSSEEEYAYYENNIISHDYILKLFAIYPVLERCVFETIEQCVLNFISVIDRLNNDLKEIVKTFFSESSVSEIKRIQCDVSDSHNKGQGVYIFEFENGKKVVYKPHGLDTEIFYHNLVQRIGTSWGMEMYNPVVLNKKQYGWVEFVDYIPCKNKKEVELYFKRLGLLIFANYLVSANDIHYENLIAHGEYPVIIDLETILHNKKTWLAKTANMKINQKLDGSVLNSGILPKYIWGSNGIEGINISAINGEEGQEFPIKMATLESTFSSDMHFEYQAPKTTKKQNMMSLNDMPCNAEEYINDILTGFYKSYETVMKNKNAFKESFLSCTDLTLRFIVRNTQRYGMLLYLSYHPFFLQNGSEREMLLNILYKDIDCSDELMLKIVDEEKSDLLCGDIPYFSYAAGNTYIKGGSNKTIFNFFEKTSMQVLYDKLNLLCLEDCKEQMSYIVLSLSSLGKYHLGQRNRTGMNNTIFEKSFKKDRYLDAAESIAKYLKKIAVFNDDRDEVNWIGISIVGNKESRWNIAPLNMYLYDGVAGMAVFFYTYRIVSGDDKFEEICKALKNILFQYTEFILKNKEKAELSGAFSGESSIIYTYELLYKLTNEGIYLEYAKKHVEILQYVLEKDNNFDILLGNAGAIHILLNLYEVTKSDEYLKTAEDAAHYILDNAVKADVGIGWKSNITVNPLAGFSHGVAGIASALLRLSSLIKNEKIIKGAIEALKYEKSLFLPQYGNWCDMRELQNATEEQIGRGPVAWCHGASGILLSRMMMRKYTTCDLRDDLEKEMDIAAETTANCGFNGTHSLCHGDVGNLEILYDYASLKKEKELYENCRMYSQYLAQMFIEGKWNCGLPYGQETPTFMLGLAGMGYSMLRYYQPDLPSVISLEI